jgi:uncharacterized protein with GYD domain
VPLSVAAIPEWWTVLAAAVGGFLMATFAFSFSYTDEAWARLVATPADRTPAVRRTVEDAGGALTALYYTVEGLEGFALVEAPDVEVADTVGLVIRASGSFDEVRIQQLVSAADFVSVLTRAQKTAPGYRAPGT